MSGIDNNKDGDENGEKSGKKNWRHDYEDMERGSCGKDMAPNKVCMGRRNGFSSSSSSKENGMVKDESGKRS